MYILWMKVNGVEVSVFCESLQQCHAVCKVMNPKEFCIDFDRSKGEINELQ